MSILGEKAAKSPKRRGIRLRIPIGLDDWGLLHQISALHLYTAVAFVECISSIERTLLLQNITEVTHSKCFGFVFFSRFHAYFSTSNSAVFVGGIAKIFLSPSFWHPSYTIDKIIVVGLIGCSNFMYILNKIKKLENIVFLSRNFSLNMPKNVLFSIKNCKNHQTLGDLPPDHLVSGGWGLRPQTPTSVILHCEFFSATAHKSQTYSKSTKRPYFLVLYRTEHLIFVINNCKKTTVTAK